MTKSNKTPDWLIERLALGELDAAAAEEVRARLRAEGRDVDQVLAELAASNRAALEAMPARQVAASIRARATNGAPRRRMGLYLLTLPVVAAATYALLAGTRNPDIAQAPGVEDTRIKGDAKLLVYRQRPTGTERLASGDRAARGDRLQLTYISYNARAAYGVVVSLDGAGRVTAHLPGTFSRDAAALRVSSQMVSLPSSYELDDAPAFERFFLITAPKPFAVAPVLDAARALAGSPAARKVDLALPPGLMQTSVLIEKSRKEQP